MTASTRPSRGTVHANSGRLAGFVVAALRCRFYPAVLQWLTSATFLVVLVSALLGPNNSGQNLGMVLVWAAWWPLLPWSFLVAGRHWCAVCPFSWLTDVVQRRVGVHLPAPRVLQRGESWVIAGAFLAVTFVDEAWRLGEDARRTAYLLLVLIAAVVFFAAFFERRTFCRYLCFIGAFARNYSRAGLVQLRAASSRCESCCTPSCHDGTVRTPGCPAFLYVPRIEDSGTCHLCGQCVKNCPRDAIRVSFRPPTAELWDLRDPQFADGVMAAILAGVVLIEQAGLLRRWVPLVETTGATLRVDPYVWYPLVYGVLLAAFILAPLLGLGLAGLLSQALAGGVARMGVAANVARFGPAMIPLALASHLAYGCHVLLTRSRSLPAAAMAVAGWFPAGTSIAAWCSTSVILWIEIAILAAGGAGSLYVGYRLATVRAGTRSGIAFLPHAAVLLLLLASNVYVVSAVLREAGP
jgi:NAD-dependent dihydropyrimidine dehydrogenase PreA subunit